MRRRWDGILVLLAACATPAVVTSTTMAPVTLTTVPPTTTVVTAAPATTQPDYSWEVVANAPEGVGISNGDQFELFDLKGNLVASRKAMPLEYLGDAGRTFYWVTNGELSGPFLTRESIISLLPEASCQFPADPFFPTGPYLAACAGDGQADRPRQIVEIDPVTMTPLDVLASAAQWPYRDGWARWARSGPNGEVIVQFSLECEVPIAYQLEDGVYNPVWPDGEVNTIHLGWTNNGGSILQVLAGYCGLGGPPGIYVLDGDAWRLVVEGEGSAFHWVEMPQPSYNANVRELRLIDAFNVLGVEMCCGEPHHGSSSASMGMSWNGVDLYVGAVDITRADRSATVIDTYEIGPVTVTILDHEPGEHHRFACGDTIYGITAWNQPGPLDTSAVEALIDSLGCNP